MYTTTSIFTGEKILRWNSMMQSADDLIANMKMKRQNYRRTGSCTGAVCCGWNAQNVMWAVTHDIDEEFSTDYQERLKDWILSAQSKGLAVAGAMTDAKGDRSLKPSQQTDPDTNVRVVEIRDDGIVIRGAKVMICGTAASHEVFVLPGGIYREADQDFAVACVVPRDISALQRLGVRKGTKVGVIEWDSHRTAAAAEGQDLSHWRVVTGGARLTKGLAMAARELGIKVTGGYGLSESCPLLTIANLKPFMEEEWDERPLAIIVPAEGAEKRITAKAMQEHLQKCVADGVIAKWAVPEHYVFVEELPRTNFINNVLSSFHRRQVAPDEQDGSPERLVRVGCPAHNCGGRCLLVAHVKEGIITHLDTDDRPDTLAAPQLRACVRGRAYLRRQYHPDRLRYPMKRVGARGEGKFERISWDEALDTVADQMRRVKETYGNSALFVPYGTGSYNQLNGSQTARRLMNLFGSCLGIYNSYSWAAINVATPTVYGTRHTGNHRLDWLNSRYILMWGWNPAEMRDGTNSDFFVKLARQNGARVVCIDPRHTLSAASLADEWIPIRPGTDAAMMSAMAYVMMAESLYDTEFVRTHCVGFDQAQMPAGAEGAESYSDYILGARDGTPKTPEWAAEITAVPRDTIVRVAREYATVKPGILYQGYGMQRRAYGEQVVRAGCVLAAITGNVGIPGGWASGLGLQPPDGGPLENVFPVGENPVKAAIPVFLWTEAVLRGREMGPQDGVIGAERLEENIKLIYAVATNALINQHANINRTAGILRDEGLVKFIAVQDNFCTPTGRFADILLPACTQFETWGLEDGWKYGDEVILMPRLVEPLAETKSDYCICAELAGRLGIGEAYTEGRDERDWVEWILDQYRETRFPGLPSLDEFEASNVGVYAEPVTQPAVAFADFCADPEAHPLNTPSGKIEIFSKPLYDMGNPAEIPPVPKYVVQEWESPFGPEAKKYPLQVIGHHYMGRVNSTHDNVDWLEEAFPQRVFINAIDAQARGIADGDMVKVYNERGAMILPCRVTNRILPGVVNIPQGAWWTPDENGVDRRGSVNVLTSERWTPLAFGTAQHTIMVQVEKAG